MLDIDSMARTRRVICVKKYLEDYKSPGKAFLNEILIPVGGKLILYCNFDTSNLSIYLPSFYKQRFDAWSEVNAKTPSLLHEIANDVIWNTVNSLCSGHCRDLKLVSSVARVRNSGSLFQSNVCNSFLPEIYLLSVLSGRPL